MNIVEQRAEHYGSGHENLLRIADLWSAYLGVPITASEVCWMMVMLKASRAKVNAEHLDNYLDAHGYLDLAERLR
jgi:Domain of unknown function (DUF6378)